MNAIGSKEIVGDMYMVLILIKIRFLKMFVNSNDEVGSKSN
jgi:hypothetical protein